MDKHKKSLTYKIDEALTNLIKLTYASG